MVMSLIQVELVESDVKAGLKLSPAVKEATIVDRPVDGIRFVQYRAKISGTVHCLGIADLYYLSVNYSIAWLLIAQFVLNIKEI